MEDSGKNTTVLVAIVGVIGTLGAALIANWDKFGPHDTKTSAVTPQAGAMQPSSVAGPIQPPPEPSDASIGGVWRDPSNPANRFRVTQNGSKFRYTGSGTLNGIAFQSSGSGSVEGRAVTSSYTTTYQTGAVARGECNGSVSADGNQLNGICQDSLLGTYPSVALRE